VLLLSGLCYSISFFSVLNLVMILDLVFVRHGLSCANALQNKRFGSHIFYRDPELTKAGVHMSKALSAALIKNLEARWSSEPYSVGASRMIRAQETAYHMICSTFGYPINIFPHVGEAGITRDNFSLATGEQIKIMKARYPGIVELLLKGRDGREPQNLFDKSNFAKFLAWAPEHPEWFGLGSDGHYRAVIFTHSHFLMSAFHMPMKLSNNDAVHVIIDTERMGVLHPEVWPLSRGLNGSASTCPDGCLITACSSVGGVTRKRLRRSKGSKRITARH